MFRFFLSFALLFLCCISYVQADEKEGMLEFMGNITREGVIAREKPDVRSNIESRIPKGSKIIVIGESGDWYKVRLYNRREAYVSKDLVEFRNDRKDDVTNTDIEKKFMVDVRNMTDQFNQMVKESNYFRRHNIVPHLSVADGSKRGGTTIVTVVYNAIDTTGKPVPSMKENPLCDTMVKFIEVVFMKMVLYDSDTYKIVFRVPVFSGGKVVEYKDGAEYTVERTETDLFELRSGNGKIWDYIVSSVPAAEFFKSFPH